MADTPHIARTLVALGAILALTACGGGGGGTGGPPADVAGTWEIHEDIDDSACGGSGDTDDYLVSVTQSGNAITVTAPAGVFTGTVNGNVISWTGEYQDPDGGWVTITSMKLTVNGNQLSGPTTWDFRDTQNGPVECSGSTQVTGTRI